MPSENYEWGNSWSKELLLLCTHSATSENSKESCGCMSRQSVKIFLNTFSNLSFFLWLQVNSDLFIWFFKTVCLVTEMLEGWKWGVVAFRADSSFFPLSQFCLEQKTVKKRGTGREDKLLEQKVKELWQKLKEQERAFKEYIAQLREEIRDIEETSTGTCVLLGENEDCSLGG